MTIKEIALKAGVSIGTVDRVIHKRGRVSQDTIKKVNKIINDFGYKPNIFASNLSSSKKYIIGILMPNEKQDSGYWAIQKSGINQSINELQIYNFSSIYFTFNKYNVNSFYKACDNLLKSNIDGLIISPILSKQTEDYLINKIPDNIPYVLIDSDLPTANYLSFIGQDPFQSGFVAAKLMSLLVKDNSSISILRITPDDYHIQQRAKGFIDYFKNDKRFNCFSYDIESGDNHQKIHKLLLNIIENYNNLKGIFVTNDSVHHIAKFLSTNYKSKGIKLIGYDLIRKNIYYLKNGYIDFLISQKPFSQGYKSIQIFFRNIILKEKIKNKVMMPIDIITKENIDYYFNENS